MRGALVAVGVGLVSALASALTPAAAGRLDPREVLATSEAAIGRTLSGHVLTDTSAAPLPLASYRGKPLVVSLVYSSCSTSCPATTQHLIDAVEQATRLLGSGRFAVLTVGFDARHDTPTRMAQFAAMQGLRHPHWKVASADTATIEALLRDLGFSYAAAAGGFEHITQTTIIDRNGRIYRHVYGEDFPIQMFMEPLKDVVLGKLSSYRLDGLIDRFKFICTTFDPGAGRYRFDYGLMFGSVLGALSLLVMGAVIWREWRRTSRA